MKRKPDSLPMGSSRSGTGLWFICKMVESIVHVLSRRRARSAVTSTSVFVASVPMRRYKTMRIHLLNSAVLVNWQWKRIKFQFVLTEFSVNSIRMLKNVRWLFSQLYFLTFNDSEFILILYLIISCSSFAVCCVTSPVTKAQQLEFNTVACSLSPLCSWFCVPAIRNVHTQLRQSWSIGFRHLLFTPYMKRPLKHPTVCVRVN